MKKKKHSISLSPCISAAGSDFNAFYTKGLVGNTQNNCQQRNLLGIEKWRAVNGIKHCEKGLPLK